MPVVVGDHEEEIGSAHGAGPYGTLRLISSYTFGIWAARRVEVGVLFGSERRHYHRVRREKREGTESFAWWALGGPSSPGRLYSQGGARRSRGH